MQRSLTKIIIIYTWLLSITYYSLCHPAPNESWYQNIWCMGMGGIEEKKMADGRRIDCLTENYAIEMDFASKWQEALGQSLEYSILANKKAGIVLILTKQSDYIYWDRLNLVVNTFNLPIKLWKLGP
jgi:hypothetical protein